MVHGWNAEVPTQSHRLVLMKLVDCCDDDGKNIFPKVRNVAKAAKCSERHVHRVLGEFLRIGLLRRVKVGGRGREDATRYEMNLDLLHMLRRVDTWPALMAAAQHQPIPEDADEHDADACDGAEIGPDTASVKGDTGSPLDADRVTPETGRVTPETPKYDKLSHPHKRTPQLPLNSEREGAQAREGMPANEGEPDRRLPATLEEFRKAYPQCGADDQTKVENAWNELPFDQRRAAIDGIPGFLAVRVAAKQTLRLAAFTYLRGKNWLHVPKQAAEQVARQAAGAFVEVKSWSKEWWLTLHLRVAEGARQRLSFMIQQAEAHKPISVSQADLDAAARRIGELKTFHGRGPEIEAWRHWLAERGARIPVFGEGSSARVFLPSEMPPREPRDDDNVPL